MSGAAAEGLSLLLLSGGVESTALLYQEHAAGRPLRALWIDYGQRAARYERICVEYHCERLNIPLARLNLATLGAIFRAEAAHDLHVPLPHRNLVALALGFSFASTIRARALLLALNRDDTQDYASAGAAFLAQWRALGAALEPHIETQTPLIAFTKAEVVRTGDALGIAWRHTYSCLLGHAVHCGRCPQCRKRRAAFAAADVLEPAEFYRR